MWIVNVSQVAAPRIFTLSKYILLHVWLAILQKPFTPKPVQNPRFVFHFAKNLIQVARC
jgi:hypothetical protein